jgi:hypothetical protein
MHLLSSGHSMDSSVMEKQQCNLAIKHRAVGGHFTALQLLILYMASYGNG